MGSKTTRLTVLPGKPVHLKFECWYRDGSSDTTIDGRRISEVEVAGGRSVSLAEIGSGAVTGLTFRSSRCGPSSSETIVQELTVSSAAPLPVVVRVHVRIGMYSPNDPNLPMLGSEGEETVIIERA